MNAILLSVLAAAAVLAAPEPARAQSFDVPEGFASEIVRKSGLGADAVSVLRVRPEDGSFSGLSHVDLAPLPGPMADPDDWLRGRMTASLDAALPDPHAMLDGPDSPFADPAFDSLRATLGAWVESVARLGDLPLEFCGAPESGANPAGAFRQLRCALPLGPFRKHLALRLQEAEGIWYYTRITAMNERRMGDLLAIADSFRIGPSAAANADAPNSGEQP